MNEQVREYIDKYPSEIVDMYNNIRQIIFDSVSSEPEETLWAKLPSYYVGETFVRLIPFKDHINIEANAISEYKDVLSGYKVTPKGMLQIFLKQELNAVSKFERIIEYTYELPLFREMSPMRKDYFMLLRELPHMCFDMIERFM